MSNPLREFLTYEQAVAMLPDRDKIHTWRGFIGASWDREDILKALRDHQPELSGHIARSHGYGLCFDDGSVVFVETREVSP